MSKEFLNGNPGLKISNVSERITKEEANFRIREIQRCCEDIIYFAEKYVTIISPKDGKHIIKLYEKQKEALVSFAKNNRVVCTASRQVGKTTLFCIIALHFILFNSEKRVLVASNKQASANDVLDRIKLAYENIPGWLKSGIVVWNKSEIVLGNNSGIKTVATSSDSARGNSCSMLILDEFAFCPRNIQDSFFTSVYPIISSDPNSRVIIVSTPNGVGEMFHTIWEKANSGDSDDTGFKWKPVRIDWWEVPGRDEKWRRQQLESLGSEETFAQEFGNSFLRSSIIKLVSDERILNYRRAVKTANIQGITQLVNPKDPKKQITYTQYHPFNPDKTYICAGDPSDGTGSDYSVVYILDITNFKNIRVCAKYASNTISTTEFAYVVYYMCKEYHNPYVMMERNGIGASTLDALTETVFDYQRVVKMNKHFKPGIQSHVQIKSKACIWFRELLSCDEFSLEINDEVILDEAEVFTKKQTDQHTIYSAIKGRHDDHLMTLIWALFILQKDEIVKYFNVEEWLITSIGTQVPLKVSPLDPYEIDNDEALRINRHMQIFGEKTVLSDQDKEYAMRIINQKDDIQIYNFGEFGSDDDDSDFRGVFAGC